MVDYQVQIYTNTMNYQNILYNILLSGGPVVASSNLVIPTAENERLTRKCRSFLFGRLKQWQNKQSGKTQINTISYYSILISVADII